MHPNAWGRLLEGPFRASGSNYGLQLIRHGTLPSFNIISSHLKYYRDAALLLAKALAVPFDALREITIRIHHKLESFEIERDYDVSLALLLDLIRRHPRIYELELHPSAILTASLIAASVLSAGITHINTLSELMITIDDLMCYGTYAQVPVADPAVLTRSLGEVIELECQK
ncbi:hypothetical protein B0H13DRAFT_2311704 [Mycena leptocephala]|nr:hypothetical protein B0H13DRAFT_2311704 [Mycena leptocephala]